MLSALPSASRAAAESLALYTAPVEFNGLSTTDGANLRLLREAVSAQRMVAMVYVDAKESNTQRLVRPLGCFYWGRVWTLVAWCESRHDFRSFRVDRIKRLEVTEDGFRMETGKTLADFLRTVAS